MGSNREVVGAGGNSGPRDSGGCLTTAASLGAAWENSGERERGGRRAASSPEKDHVWLRIWGHVAISGRTGMAMLPVVEQSRQRRSWRPEAGSKRASSSCVHWSVFLSALVAYFQFQCRTELLTSPPPLCPSLNPPNRPLNWARCIHILLSRLAAQDARRVWNVTLDLGQRRQ